jgi:hypothetical protein
LLRQMVRIEKGCTTGWADQFGDPSIYLWTYPDPTAFENAIELVRGVSLLGVQTKYVAKLDEENPILGKC